jgi:hypothetical protein
LYGTRPTIGNHHVYRSSRSRYAPDSTRTSVSPSSWLYVVKLSFARKAIESSANARAASTSWSFERTAGGVRSSRTSSGIGRRRARIFPSSQPARAM